MLWEGLNGDDRKEEKEDMKRIDIRNLREKWYWRCKDGR